LIGVAKGEDDLLATTNDGRGKKQTPTEKEEKREEEGAINSILAWPSLTKRGALFARSGYTMPSERKEGGPNGKKKEGKK